MIEILSVKQHGQSRRFKFLVPQVSYYDTSHVSEDHHIFKFAMVRFRIENAKEGRYYYSLAMKTHEDEYVSDFTVTAKATLGPYGSTVTIDCSANWSDWFTLTSYCTQWSFYVDIELIINKKTNLITTKLYRDETLTDFQLSAEDGSVAVHRAYLAAHSDMFNTMFHGKWKETEQGQVELKGVTQQTLQDLKDFIYMNTLPDDWLRLSQLLMLATQYLVDSLKPSCIMKLIQKITPENVDAFIKFAVDNKMHELKESILEDVPEKIFAAAYVLKIKAMAGDKDEDA